MLPEILILGASGSIGMAMIVALQKRHGAKVKITAGVRDPSKLKQDGIAAVKADMGEPDELVETLTNFDRVYIVTSGYEDRSKLAVDAIGAARIANVKFVLFTFRLPLHSISTRK